MQFSTVEVVKTKENYFYIAWDLIPDVTTTTTTATPAPTTSTTTSTPIISESIDDYKFQIHWARDPATGFLPILNEHSDPIEIDGAIGPLEYTHRLNQYDFSQDSYYKILAIKKDLTLQFFSSITFVGMHFDGVQDSIRYVEEILYSQYVGEPCKIIKRKSFGARCTKCWSPERQQRILSHCDVCDSTGYIAGFYKPIDAHISFNANPKISEIERDWENVFIDNQARMSNYPMVRAKDIIVTEDNMRLVITDVRTTKLPMLSKYKLSLSKQNYILSQLLTLKEINSDDDEYVLDIDNITNIPITDEGDTGSTAYANNRYYGTNAKIILTDSDILALSKEPCLAIANTHEYDCSSGRYIWICYPSRFGMANFTVNGFESEFILTVQPFTNEDGYTENFNCFRSYRLQHNETIIVVVS